MAKRQSNFLKMLEAERYLVWAIVFIAVVGVGLLTEITAAKAQMDLEISSSMFIINNKK
jgi:hypothetical protein